MPNPDVSKSGFYHHTQRGPWSALLYALAAVFLAAGWFMPGVPLKIIVLGCGLAELVLARAFGQLTVADEGDQLALRFGPLPLFQRRIRYDEIRVVERGRTALLDGWGIHWNPWSGWVWNIWGRDCIVLRLERGIVRIGTDDREGLAQLLKMRVAQQIRPEESCGR